MDPAYFHDFRKDFGGRVCPYGQVGDRLWVRETWMVGNYGDASECSPINISYRAGGNSLIEHSNLPNRAIILAKQYGFQSGNWRPSIFMPKWASRITLEITGVRVEQVQRISISDALAEGIEHKPFEAISIYQKLWDSINAKRGYGWASNPWTWVLEFKRVEK